MSLQERVRSWSIKRAADEIERERVAALNGAPPRNDPSLFAPTKVRCLRPFCVHGKDVKAGEVVMLAKHDADSLIAIKRAEKV